MKPITISCEETLSLPPETIAAQILDVTQWPGFTGYGVLPGIKVASFELRTPEIIGSRIRVTNTDGSTHIEEIVHWQPATRLQLNMKEFASPLSRLATEFEEVWEFERRGEATRVVRSCRMHAQSWFTRPLLWAISLLLRKALVRHLRVLRDNASAAHATAEV